MPDHPHPDALALLHAATQRLVRTVDALGAEDLAGASILPGWTRAHVVAHLALNAEALAGVLEGVARGLEVPMYPSAEARDADIAELASTAANPLRERLMETTTVFADALNAMPADRWGGTFPRTPGGAELPVGAVPLMRWREVEIHHVDLDAGYTSREWPEEFTIAVLDSMRAREWPVPFRVLARDLARTWEYGDVDDGLDGGPDGGAEQWSAVPTVTGEAADLAWWLTGRGDGATLTADNDELPEVLSW